MADQRIIRCRGMSKEGFRAVLRDAPVGTMAKLTDDAIDRSRHQEWTKVQAYVWRSGHGHHRTHADRYWDPYHRILVYPTTEQETPMTTILDGDRMTDAQFQQALVDAPVGTVATSAANSDFDFTKINETTWTPKAPGVTAPRDNLSDAWSRTGRTLRYPPGAVVPPDEPPPGSTTELDLAKAALADLKKRVVEVAREAAEKHGWCDVVEGLLRDLDLVNLPLYRHVVLIETRGKPDDVDWDQVCGTIDTTLRRTYDMDVTDVRLDGEWVIVDGLPF